MPEADPGRDETSPAGDAPRPVEAEAAIAAIVQAMQTLDRDGCAALGRLYAPDARFRDPFNDVTGREAVVAIYRHMYDQLDAPRFAVTRTVGRPGSAEWVLFWDFTFRFRRPLPRTPQTVAGCTLMLLDAQGRIALHQDYWDPASGIYERIPLLGPVLGWIRRRNAAPG